MEMEKSYFVMDKPKAAIHNNNDTNTDNSYIPPEIRIKVPQSLSVPCPSFPPPYNNDYLTPSSEEPPDTHALSPQLPAIPAVGFGRRSPQSPLMPGEDGRWLIPRTDSGIEADICSRGRLSSTCTTNPRSSTIYECIDSGNLCTDPSNAFFCGRSAGETNSSGVSSLPARANIPTVASDSEDGLEDSVRRHLNPVYNSLNQSTPQLYTETCHCSKSSKLPARSALPPRRHLRYLWCGLVVLAVITLFLLAVIAYVFVLLIPGMQAHIRIQDDEIKRMGSVYQNLTERVDALVWFPPANRTTLSETHASEGVVDTITQLNNSVREFGSQLQQLSYDLQVQINDASRTPDLKGVTGVGQLDSCFHYNATSVQALPGPPSTTSWLPDTDTDLFRDNMVMSVTCGVYGGTVQFVETQVLSPSQVQYRCRCGGRVESYRHRKCRIQFLLCPRLLPLRLALVPPE